jgi:hypothetical protein
VMAAHSKVAIRIILGTYYLITLLVNRLETASGAISKDSRRRFENYWLAYLVLCNQPLRV